MNLSNENVLQIQKNGIEYLQFRKLLEYSKEINHAYSLGLDKNYRTIKGDPQIKQDYQNLCEAIDTKLEHLVSTCQEHTDEVKIVKEKGEQEKYLRTDGLITNQKNVLLSSVNADCILVLFFDPVKKVIANTHSGWRGTLQRIVPKTIQKMKKEFKCDPKDIIACICPSIRKCHFEVEQEVKDDFEKEFQDIEEIEEIIEETIPNQKWHIDTVKINQILLQKEGLKEENIVDSGICSVCHSDFIHSYRVERQGYYRNAALIELKEEQ